MLQLNDLSASDIAEVIDSAMGYKARPSQSSRSVASTAACLFEKPSTRTRLSFAVAAHRLGMAVQVLDAGDLQLANGESLADTARALSLYVDIITYRTFSQSRLEEFADAASVPVINALTNDHHPCQALADVMTLRERFGDLRGLKVAWLGDATGNVANSLMQAASILGFHVMIAAPEAYWPRSEVLNSLQHSARSSDRQVTVTVDVNAAVEGADVVYPEAWVPMDRQNETSERTHRLATYSVTREVMALAKPSAILLHCLPAHRGQEVSSDVLDGQASAVWQQAANRLYISQAILHKYLAASPSE